MKELARYAEPSCSTFQGRWGSSECVVRTRLAPVSCFARQPARWEYHVWQWTMSTPSSIPAMTRSLSIVSWNFLCRGSWQGSSKLGLIPRTVRFPSRMSWSPKQMTETRWHPRSILASSRVRYSTWTPAPPYTWGGYSLVKIAIRIRDLLDRSQSQQSCRLRPDADSPGSHDSHWIHLQATVPRTECQCANRRPDAEVAPDVTRLLRRSVQLKGVSHQYNHPQILDRRITLADYDGLLRQVTVADLGHEELTLLLTNQLTATAARLIERYAQRMIIENRIADGIDFFHMDALSSVVAMKVNCDLQLTLMASSLYRLLAGRIGRGYEQAESRHLFQDFVNATAQVKMTESDIVVRYQKRAHNPLLIAAGFDTTETVIPWLGRKRLRLVFGWPHAVAPRGAWCKVKN